MKEIKIFCLKFYCCIYFGYLLESHCAEVGVYVCTLHIKAVMKMHPDYLCLKPNFFRS